MNTKRRTASKGTVNEDVNMSQPETNKQTIDKVERRLLAGELDASTTTLADVLPDAAKAAFAGYGIAATMQGAARRIAAFMDVLNGCLQFRRENPKLYDAIYEANAEVEELRFCKNIAVEDEMPPIFSGLLTDFYGIKPNAGSGKKNNGEESLKPVHAIIVGEQAEQLAATNENTEWLKSEEARKKSNREKVGRENQRNGEKNDNGRKTDEKLKNQIMTEMRQTMKKNKCSQSSACRIVCEKHLKADGKTPIFSKRTIENWMSRANRRKKP